MNHIRTAPAIAGLLLLPTAVLFGGFTPAFADEPPVAEPTASPTDVPTEDPTPIEDCSQYGEDAFASDDGQCVILGPPPVAPTDDPTDDPTPDHGDVVGPPPHGDPPPLPDPEPTPETTPETETETTPETEPEPANETVPPVVEVQTELLTARSGDAPAASSDQHHDGGAIVLVGLGLGLAGVGSVVIRRKLRQG